MWRCGALAISHLTLQVIEGSGTWSGGRGFLEPKNFNTFSCLSRRPDFNKFKEATRAILPSHTLKLRMFSSDRRAAAPQAARI